MSGDERELIRRARAGSREAVDALLERFTPVVEDYLERRVGPRMRRHTSISDLRQDVLMRLDYALGALGPEASFADLQALLLRHAQWAIGRAARSARAFAGESAGGDHRTPSSTPAPEPTRGDVTRNDELARLAADVGALEPALAEAVHLRLEGKTFGAIASALGIGEDAARKRLLRAALILRARRGSVAE